MKRLMIAASALLALGYSAASLASEATQIVIPRPYTAALVDGQKVNTNFLSSQNNVPLNQGPHQVVVQFEKNYSNRQSDILAGEPVVINFEAKPSTQYKLQFNIPYTLQQGKALLQNQISHLKLVDSRGETVKAEIYQMPPKEGWQLARDLNAELTAQGKSFQQLYGTGATQMATIAPAQQAQAAQQRLAKMSQPKILEQLQQAYRSANEQTKKSFEIWTIEQR